MLIEEIKNLIYLIEGKIKEDSRFDNSLREKMKFLAYKKNIVQNYIPVPIIDMEKINQLEEKNKEINKILKLLVSKNTLDDDFLKEHLANLEKINKSIKSIIS